MIKKLPLLFVLLLGMLKTQAQDSVQYRMILIGDAGEMDLQQSAVLKHAAANVLKNKTSVFYLGDNVYPRGMGLPGSPEETETQKILQSQYQPMRAAGAPVYFIPGNHDWDKMGPLGLVKIKRQWEYLDQQGDKLLKMVPENGCPDPVEINLTNDLTVIAFDSEWWLYPFNKSNPGAECDCKNKDDIADKIKLIFERNKDKVIILASHHPFQSYGTHGGYFSLKDHIFPLTVVNKDLWVPLPVIGSLYPFLRSTFSNPEDLGHPLYKDMIKKVDAVFGSFPNLIHVAGHEHGLQFIKSKQLQVVSGAGAKQTYAIKGKYSLFADATQGYVTADLLIDKRMRFTYYIDSDKGVKQVFTYTQPYTSVKNVPDTLHTPIKTDSVMVRVHPKYDSVSNFHRRWFGENYRKEWAAETKLPVIRLSEIHGGLKTESIGGGFQTHSLRLIDKDGKEWVLRSVEKQPEKILPDEFQETFAKDWVNDAMSAQHPFSALIVPPLADAARVPHANPIIGVVSADPVLGQYANIFANKVCLLEEREPGGKSDNTVKMIGKMLEDNDNTVDGEEFLRARLLDLLIGDWDRHGDQWRWRDEDKGKGKFYTAVPRDRDQVFYTNQGVLPTIAAQPWIAPNLQGFSGEIYSVKYSLWKTMFMQRWPSVQYSHEQWTKIVNDFVAAETDEVLEAGLRRLPESSYKLRHDVLLKQLKERRANIPAEMEYYYKFINKIVDIHTSNKNELVTVKDEPNGSLNVIINKINKDGEVKDTLMNQNYHPDITKELRIYVSGGDDKVVLDNATSPIKLRFIDSTGTKTYNIVKSLNTVQLYDRGKKLSITGDESKVTKHISKDSANTSYLRVNLMNVIAPLANISYNPDEGVLLGAGFKYTHQEGFQKLPYNDVQTVFASHSFTTKAFKIKYSGEWIHAFGNADFLMDGQLDYPDNINFFGRGNETPFIKVGDYRKYHRTRFTNFTFSPAFRWRNESGTSVTVGPAFQYYKLDVDDNTGRFITYPLLTNAPDSYTFDKTKMHAGIVVNFTSDKRNDKVLPAWGSFINIKLQEFNGLNNNSTSFAQLIPQVALYKSLNAKSTIVLADRVGGGITIGKTAFYQSLFLGGQDNLLGYRLYRFAGQHSFYNNLELRIKLTDFASYIVPGQIGVIGFYDIGRVWENGQSSDKWHNGTGAGFYVAPARLAVIKIIAGYSEEGWYPYLQQVSDFNEGKTVIKMHTEVLNISKNECTICQVETCLTFNPFVAHLKERIATEKTLKSEFYRYVLERFEHDICIDLDMRPTDAEKYREMLELIYSILTPPIANEKEFHWALSTPVPDKIFFSTEAFYDFHSSHHSNLYALNVSKNEMFSDRQKRFIYNLILERMYGFSSAIKNELLFSYEDPETGLSRYFNIQTDARFVEIELNGELPELSFDTIEPYLHSHTSLELIEKVIPLNIFKFKGFSIITLTDVTLTHALENIRTELVNHSANEEEQYAHIISSLKTLAESPGIEFGLMPFLTINNEPIFDNDECSRSILLKAAKDFNLAEETFDAIIDDYNQNPRPIFFNSITDEKIGKFPFLQVLKQAGIKSYGIFPVYYNKKNVGIMEVFSYKEIVFYEKLLSKLQATIPLIAQLLQNSIDQFEARIAGVIKNKFTSLQPSVQWKFNEVAWKYLKEKGKKKKSQEIETVAFQNVYPLFGAVDIRNSTVERNSALQEDLKNLLTILIETLKVLNDHIHLSLTGKLVSKCEEWLERISGYITTNDELMLDTFLHNEINPFLEHFRNNYPAERETIDRYFNAMNEETGASFENRRNLETSMQLINTSINQYLEQAQTEVQESFPCYFEKFRTDGVEYDIYIGQSIAPQRVFDMLYLKNIRLWQLRSMAEIARMTNDLSDQLSRPLQTTHLIFIHSNAIDISFRNDERRFDVEGAYNIRYEVIKKRIDKVLIAGTFERLTQPGKIAMVYFNPTEAAEYDEYIRYLQVQGYLLDDLEYLELEELQGVTGLKALRVGVNYQLPLLNS